MNKRCYILIPTMLLTAATVLAERNIASPLETKVEKLPPAASIKVPAGEVAAMKKIEAKEWTVPGLDLKMVRIPAGTFMMGSPPDEDSRRDDETRHEVTLSKPFYMGVYELTQRQYYRLFKADYDFDAWGHFRGSLLEGMPLRFRSVVSTMGSDGYELLLDNPMESLGFFDAMKICAAINAREKEAGRLPEGYAYRLPTEAEWEYACRAGTEGMFALGDERTIIEEAKLAEEGKSAQRELRRFASWLEVTTVGHRRKPNAWGLYDMHGNVAEWVLDSYAPYEAEPQTDPLVINDAPEKVVRGGSYAAGYAFMRSAARYAIPADIDYYSFVGMRLVLAPKVEVPMTARPIEAQPDAARTP